MVFQDICKAMIITIMIIGLLSIISCSKNKNEDTNLYPVDSFQHAHGLAVARDNNNIIYIATHHGLYALINETQLYRVGKTEDDLMGFLLHPTNPKIMLSSGHPQKGGNIGVQISKNKGITWETISSGNNGPVDFHAMAISYANPNIIYGWYHNALQRSLDGGYNWERLTTNLPASVMGLETHSTNENVVFANALEGLFRSNDKGVTWELKQDQLKDSIVIAFVNNPTNADNALAFSKKMGLTKTVDNGDNWITINEKFNGEMVLFLAYDPTNTSRVYALTKNNVIFKSENEGDTWNKIR